MKRRYKQGKIGKTLKFAPGDHPTYEMQTGFGPVQPILVRGELAFCPAEGWQRISTGIGFYPVICPVTKSMHTAYPDPVTRRRMRESFNRSRSGA